MERHIGEVFEYSPGVWLKVAPWSFSFNCKHCFFTTSDGSCNIDRKAVDGCAAPQRCYIPVPAPVDTLILPDKPSEERSIPSPVEWLERLSEAWQAEIQETARDAFVYRYWDLPNTVLARVMGISEATVRRARKKRIKKNFEE